MIYVFKTSVNTSLQIKRLEPYLNKILPAEKWNFDLEDCDRILRIDSKENIVVTIIVLLKDHNIHCEELE